MSYVIYTTRGLVLKSWSLREADKTYAILTRDLGLVRARALGVRKEASKLRGSLEPLCLSNVSLVKGQREWRITSVDIIATDIKLDDKKLISKSLYRGLDLLEKLTQGEEIHPEVFDAVEEIFLWSSEVPEELSGGFEILLVSRILFHLGYLSSKDVPEGVTNGELSADLLKKIEENKKKIIEVINLSLRSTHLVSVV